MQENYIRKNYGIFNYWFNLTCPDAGRNTVKFFECSSKKDVIPFST
jgi:hypothetical protein